MSLILPTNFEKDIQSKNTNLFPIVRFGSVGDNDIYKTHIYSVGAYSCTDSYAGNLVTIPILLNIPSLRESIDIDKRNYKISNLTLQFSNAEHDGVRLSDKISEDMGAFVNTECRIFWGSPSGISLHPQDTEPDSTPLDAVFQVFYGHVRKYEHSDETVTLTIEDRSQAKLHRDLPSQYSPADETLAERYRNKPIPMVYGEVDRSPLMAFASTANISGEDVVELELKADTMVTKAFVEDVIYFSAKSLPLSPLYFFEDDTYFNIARTTFGEDLNSDALTPLSVENFQVDPENSRIVLDATGFYDGSEEVINDISQGFLRTHILRTFEHKEAYLYDGDYEVAGEGLGYVYYDNPYIGKLEGEVDVLNPAHLGFNAGAFKVYLNPIGSPTSDIKQLNTFIFYSSVPHPISQVAAYAVYVGPDSNLGYDVNDTVGLNNAGNQYGFYGKPVHDNVTQIGSDPIKPFQGNAGEIFTTVNQYEFIKFGIPKHFNQNVLTDAEAGELDAGHKFLDFYLVHRLFVEGISDKDYYANVIGRLEAPNAPQAISHIIANELFDMNENPMSGYNYTDNTGEMVVQNYTDAQYDNWGYDFTIHKKINSKKLIEEIASASPFIPRFDAMGKWKFTTIGIAGGAVPEGSANHSIKNDDCISFTYRRSPVEDIATKVEFNYNWDYGNEKFKDRIVLDIVDIFGEGQYNYSEYRLKDPYVNPLDSSEIVHPDSTLVIDDERGKYIREFETAEKFANWTLAWNCNQHLIIKCRLSLKYLNLEVGDYCKFDTLLGNQVKPYAINYTTTHTLNGGQTAYNTFLITKTNKTLEYVEIECIQMHQFIIDESLSRLAPCCNEAGEGSVFGCTDNTACNYDATANFNDGTCQYPTQYYDCDGNCIAELDVCGVCGGDTINPDMCAECPEGYVEDCAGICGGDTIFDCAGVCGGDSFVNGCGECGTGSVGGDYPCCSPSEKTPLPDLVIPAGFIGVLGEPEAWMAHGYANGVETPEQAEAWLADFYVPRLKESAIGKNWEQLFAGTGGNPPCMDFITAEAQSALSFSPGSWGASLTQIVIDEDDVYNGPVLFSPAEWQEWWNDYQIIQDWETTEILESYGILPPTAFHPGSRWVFRLVDCGGWSGWSEYVDQDIVLENFEMYRPFKDIYDPTLGDPISHNTCSELACEETNCSACSHPSAWNYLPNDEIDGNYIQGNYSKCKFYSDFLSLGCPHENHPSIDNCPSTNHDPLYNHEQYNWFLDDFENLAYEYYIENLDVMQGGGTETFPLPRMIYNHNCDYTCVEPDQIVIEKINLYIQMDCPDGVTCNEENGYYDVEGIGFVKKYGEITQYEIGDGIPMSIPFDHRIKQKIEAGEDLQILLELDFGSSVEPPATEHFLKLEELMWIKTVEGSMTYANLDSYFTFNDKQGVDGGANKVLLLHTMATAGDNVPSLFATYLDNELGDQYWLDNSTGGANDFCGGVLKPRIFTMLRLHAVDANFDFDNNYMVFNNSWTESENPPDGCDGYPIFTPDPSLPGNGMPIMIDFTQDVLNPGDVNGDGSYNVLDIIALADCILDANCEDKGYYNGDVNGDGTYNVFDIIELEKCIRYANCEDI